VKTRATHAPGFAAIVAIAACRPSSLPPNGQIVLYLDTDAPLPSPPGAPPPAIPPLFDRVRVDVIRPGETDPCDGCTVVEAIDSAEVLSGSLSLGIATPRAASGYVVRVRMFPSLSTHGGEPNPDATVEVVAALPVVGAEGIREEAVFLPVDGVASPSGSLDQPTSTTHGRIARGHAGSWPGAQRVPCAGTPRDGEVCVPGGAYWMGNPLVVNGYGKNTAANLQRIVVLSPFFLDAHEVTVGEYRSRGGSAATPWSGSHAGQAGEDWCTFTSTPSADDPLPLDCIPWADARGFCQSRGADLPSEAQFEYAAGGTTSGLYVWGADIPDCSYAVYGLGGFGLLFGQDGECRALNDIGGPLPYTRPRTDRDQLVLEGGTILDLAGNVSEWALDAWEPQDGPCWGTGVLADPVCGPESKSVMRPIRGSNWYSGTFELRAAWRAVGAGDGYSPSVGFRCARPG
jgi:sulfatase modifying factor 1